MIFKQTFIVLLTFCATLAASELVKVEGDFDYCLDSYQTNPIDRDNVCDLVSYRSLSKDKMNEISSATYGAGMVKAGKDNKQIINLDVFTMENVSVEGVGFECEVRVDHWSFGLTFFGYKWQTVVEEIKQLDPEVCATMSRDHECDGNEMKCGDGICEYRDSLEEDFSYFYTVKKDVKTCIVKKRTITAKNKDATLFGADCAVTDYRCRLSHSIIVWDKQVLITCPFRRILKGVIFEITGNNLYSEDHKLSFKMRTVEKYCDTTMIKTFEGAYVTYGNNEQFYLKTNIPSTDTAVVIKAIEELNVASTSYLKFEEHRADMKNFKANCQNFKSLLQSAASINDKYFKFKDLSGIETILYSLYGELYKSSCYKIKNVYFDTKPTKCFLDFKVIATVGNKNVSAFLTHYGIVKTHSQAIKCLKNTIRKVKIPNKNSAVNKLIINKNNVQKLVNEKDFQLTKLYFLSFKLDETVNYDDIFQESMFNMLHEYGNKNVENFHLPTINKFNGSEEPVFSIKLIIILAIVGSGLVLFAIVFVTCKCNLRALCCCCTKKNESNLVQYDQVELGEETLEERQLRIRNMF